MAKGAGYFALLLGSLTVETLPWAGAAPLCLLLTALALGSREEPVTGGLLGALCGLLWGMTLGRYPLPLALGLAALALTAGWTARTLRLRRGWFVALAAAAALGVVLVLALTAGPSWSWVATWGWTVLVSPLWALMAGGERKDAVL